MALNDFHLSLTYIGLNDGAFILPAYLLTSPCVFWSGIRGVYSSSGSESGEQTQVRSTARKGPLRLVPETRSVQTVCLRKNSFKLKSLVKKVCFVIFFFSKESSRPVIFPTGPFMDETVY